MSKLNQIGGGRRTTSLIFSLKLNHALCALSPGSRHKVKYVRTSLVIVAKKKNNNTIRWIHSIDSFLHAKLMRNIPVFNWGKRTVHFYGIGTFRSLMLPEKMDGE